MQTPSSLQPPCVVDKPYYRGVITSLCRLEHTHGYKDLSELLRSNQLVSSADGSCVALLSDATLHHSQMNLVDARFEGLSAQILLVETNRVLVWGLPAHASVRGVYEYLGDDSPPNLLYAFEQVERIERTRNGFLLIASEMIGTPFGVFSLDTLLSATTAGKKAYAFLERSLEILCAFVLSDKGFESVCDLRCEKEEQAVSLVRVQRQFVLLSQTPMGARLRVVNGKDRLTFLLQENWIGTIEHLWVSPNGRSLAWLVRPDEQSDFRMLYVNGQLIHSGLFVMTYTDVTWDQTGLHFGAKILMMDGYDRQAIITSVEQKSFALNTHVREFLLDPDGTIAAYIEEQNGQSSCYIGFRHFDAVSCMWNLHHTEDGGIAFNSVIGHTVRLTSDTTDLIRH